MQAVRGSTPGTDGSNSSRLPSLCLGLEGPGLDSRHEYDYCMNAHFSSFLIESCNVFGSFNDEIIIIKW